MTGILDRFVQSGKPEPHQRFRPATPDHFIALRVADRLNDAAAVHHYADLCDRHTAVPLVTACRHALKHKPVDLAQRFHAALEQGRNGNGLPHRDLAAIRIERRAIAVAIFSGDRLKYPPVARQLSSDGNKAIGSAAMFINHIRAKCPFPNAAIEALPADCEAQRSQLTKIIIGVLAEAQVSVWQFAKSEVIAAFGHPALKFRSEVREVMSAMWPEVNGGFGSPLIKDALALGLYCQVEHLLMIDH